MKLHDKTSAWWAARVRDRRENSFLLQLRQAEAGGADRFQSIVDRFHPTGEALAHYEGIISDERRHQRLVEELLTARSVPFPSPPTPERYWGKIWDKVTTFEEACAAGAFGEMLARNRFRVILHHPDTPEDIRALVAQILPDEECHARLLGAMAGDAAMNRMRSYHLEGMAALGLVEVVEDD